MTLNRRLLETHRWTPPSAPSDAGRTALTAELVIDRLLPTGGSAPEDVMYDNSGRIVTGLEDGTIVAIDPATGERTVLANTGGRPLGVQPCADGSVLVCDHDRGLLRVTRGGGVEVVVDSIDGEKLTFASNVVAGSDGRIWFTTSTARWDLHHHEGDIVEHSCTGRLVEVGADGRAKTIVPGLAFGNGLLIAPDESFLVYAETAGYRLNRYWLTGPKAGQHEVFVDNLAGFPDNISVGSDGLAWVSIVTPRNPVIDAVLPLPGVIRQVIWNLPPFLRPKPEPIAWIMAFDLATGATVHDLRLEGGSYWFVTAVAERGGEIALASLRSDSVAIVRKP